MSGAFKENDLVVYSYHGDVFLTKLYKPENTFLLWADDVAKIGGSKRHALAPSWEFEKLLLSEKDKIKFIKNYGQITAEEFKEKNPQYFI